MLDAKVKSGFTKSYISLSRYSKFEGNIRKLPQEKYHQNPMQSAKDYKIKMGKNKVEYGQHCSINTIAEFVQ